MVKGKRKYKTEENKPGSGFVGQDDTELSMKRSKLCSNRKATNNLSTMKSHKFNIRNSKAELRGEKNVITLDYFFTQVASKNEINPTRNEIITDAEQFKTDETPVAVPNHGPPTPHRINMPLDEGTMITTKKTPLRITLHSPLQITKKPALFEHETAISNQSNIDSLPTVKTNQSITDYFQVRRSERKCKKVILEEKQRDLEYKVICQVEEGLEIRHFAGKGRGVVTTREFAKGEYVVEYIGKLISQKEAKKREKTYAQDTNTGCYMYYFQHQNRRYCVDATEETSKLGRLVNHSRNGNLVTRIIEVNSTPHLVLVAKEDIPVGTEISYDYGDRSRESIQHHPWLAL